MTEPNQFVGLPSSVKEVMKENLVYKISFQHEWKLGGDQSDWIEQVLRENGADFYEYPGSFVYTSVVNYITLTVEGKYGTLLSSSNIESLSEEEIAEIWRTKDEIKLLCKLIKAAHKMMEDFVEDLNADLASIR